jgi:hypothetical protein
VRINGVFKKNKVMKQNKFNAPTNDEGIEGDVVDIPSRKSIDVANVTRFEVVNISTDGKSRYIAEDISIADIRLQDDGKTMKVFLR